MFFMLSTNGHEYLLKSQEPDLYDLRGRHKIAAGYTLIR